MKQLIYYSLLLILGSQCYAQNTVLKASTDKFLTVQFPSKIDFFQNSVSIDDKIGIKQQDDILFIQFLEPNLPETNLFVKTIDNKSYHFLLQYDANPSQLQFIVEGTNQTVSPNLKTNDKQESTKASNTSGSVSERILKESGYIKNRNISVYKNIKVILKGIYVNQNRIYVLMRIDNKSNLPYDVNAYKFYITNDKGISASEQTIDVPIAHITPDLKVLPKGKNDLVFMFDKFSVGDNKQLLFELTERNGDRNISFKILSSLIDNAQSFN